MHVFRRAHEAGHASPLTFSELREIHIVSMLPPIAAPSVYSLSHLPIFIADVFKNHLRLFAISDRINTNELIFFGARRRIGRCSQDELGRKLANPFIYCMPGMISICTESDYFGRYMNIHGYLGLVGSNDLCRSLTAVRFVARKLTTVY